MSMLLNAPVERCLTVGDAGGVAATLPSVVMLGKDVEPSVAEVAL